MHPFIIIDNFLPKFMEEYAKGFPSIKDNFSQYLLHLIMGDSQEFFISKNLPKQQNFCNMEQYFKRALRKRQTAKNQIKVAIDELIPYFQEECSQRFLSINPYFANYLLHLIIRDAEDGLQLDDKFGVLSVCNIEQFLEKVLNKYANPLDATICNMKMTYFFKNVQELSLDFVKLKYDEDFQDKLKQLIDSILQYPETCNPKQLEEMYVKMQVFIIANYHIGCAKNYVLLKQTRQSLNSVLGKGDLQKYLLKKRYHRLEYLQKLGATVAGILIFNNQDPQGMKENMRNIYADLEMAQCNTKDSLEEGIKRALLVIEKGTQIMQKYIAINIPLRQVNYLWPLNKVHEINKFVILYEVYKRNLLQAKEVFQKTQYIIEVAQNKFNCVVEKINEILKFRSAIESEMIFPHFVYLSEVWTLMILYLNHLVEINKIKDSLDELVNEKIENKFQQLVEDISSTHSRNIQQPKVTSFMDVMGSANKCEAKLNMLSIKPFVKDYCALTMALTNGLLLPAQLDKKLCENVELRFGFANIEYAKYAERYFKDFIQAFRNALFTNSDLILLFQLDDEVMKHDFDLINQSNAKTKSLETQTEMVIANDLTPAKKINVTWNVWDYHRETIKLADLRQKQTQSTQSKLCYGIRNAQNQCSYNRDNNTQN